MGDAFVLVMDAPKRNHRILEKGDVLLDADGDPAIALTHVLSTGDDAEGQDVRNVGKLTLDNTDTAYFEEASGRIVPSVAIGLQDGAIATPALTFNSDPDTGFYRPTTDTIGFANNGAATLQVSTQGLLNKAGSAATPSYSFSADTDTGLYGTADEVHFACNGAEVGRFVASALRLVDGNESSPAYSFISDTDTGLFRSGANSLALAAGGSGRMYVTDAHVQLNTVFQITGGSAAAPGLQFSVDTDTGIYRIGADSLGASTGGVLRLSVGTTLITSTLPFKGPDGDASNPAYGFSSDVGLGIRRSANNTMAFVCNTTTQLTISTLSIITSLPIATSSGQLTLNGATGVVLMYAASWRLTCGASDVEVSQPLKLTNASAATPSVNFGDAATGFYRYAANEIGGAANGSIKFRLHSGGLSILNGGLTAALTTQSAGPFNLTVGHSTALINAGTGAITVNLPAASGLTGRIFFVKKIDASANVVTIDGNAAETIDGAATYALSTQYDGVILQCDGVNWHVLATV